MRFITRLFSQNTVALLCLSVQHIYYTLSTVLLLSSVNSFIWSPSHFFFLHQSPSHIKPDLQLALLFISVLNSIMEVMPDSLTLIFINMVDVTEMLRIIDFTMTRRKVICLKFLHAKPGYCCGGAGPEVWVVPVFKKLLRSTDNNYPLTFFSGSLSSFLF